jgi:hypothetical protein
MRSQAREIRWTKPALDFFLDQSPDPEQEIDTVYAVLVYIRDHPDDGAARLPVNKDGYRELQIVQGDLFVSHDSLWEIYYTWLPGEITVVHVEPIRKKIDPT